MQFSHNSTAPVIKIQRNLHEIWNAAKRQDYVKMEADKLIAELLQGFNIFPYKWQAEQSIIILLRKFHQKIIKKVERTDFSCS